MSKYVEFKFTQWARIEIPSDIENEIIHKLKTEDIHNPFHLLEDTDYEAWDLMEIVDDSETYLRLEDNNMHPTITLCEGGRYYSEIWNNAQQYKQREIIKKINIL